jgi:hypothetical protein
MKRAAALGLLLAVAGCAASQCNPGTAGFFAGIGCAVGGGYAERRAVLNSEAATAHTGAAAAEADVGHARAAEAEAKVDLAHQRAQLAQLAQQQRTMAAQLAAKRAGNGLTAAQLAKAQRELAELRQATRAQAEAPRPDPAAVARINASQRELIALIAKM